MVNFWGTQNYLFVRNNNTNYINFNIFYDYLLKPETVRVKALILSEMHHGSCYQSGFQQYQ